MPKPDWHKGGQRRRFCGGSCRTLAHREKSRQMPGVFAAVLESPFGEAVQYLETAGMARATALLNVAGVSWRADKRAFIDRTGRAVRGLKA
jgi:hypothetical protein